MAHTNGHTGSSVHCTGQPDTPVECLASLLSQALSLHATDPEKSRSKVQEAFRLVAGLDTYLDTISTPPSEVLDDALINVG